MVPLRVREGRKGGAHPRAEPPADPRQGGGEGPAARRAHRPRARAPAHVGPPGHHPQLGLRLREVARLEADHAHGGDPADGRGAELKLFVKSKERINEMNNATKKPTPGSKKDAIGHVVLSPSATATDGAALASCVGMKFEKAVHMRITISETSVPNPDKWEFQPKSVSVLSAWAGDVQIHLGALVSKIMNTKESSRAIWNGFEIKPRMVMQLIRCLGICDRLKGNVNIVNFLGLEYVFSSGPFTSVAGYDKIQEVRKCRYAEIVDTRSESHLQYIEDEVKVWRDVGRDNIDKLLKKTHKLSYEDAVCMVENELKVCCLVARRLLQCDNHWSYYQYEAGRTVKVNNNNSYHVSYQPKFKK